MNRHKTGRGTVGDDILDSADLKEEIRLLRELVHETASAAQSEPSVSERLRMLDVVARACGQLARLMRTQSTLGGQDELVEEIGRVAEEIRKQIAGQEDV
jgi:hypothetical protein